MSPSDVEKFSALPFKDGREKKRGSKMKLSGDSFFVIFFKLVCPPSVLTQINFIAKSQQTRKIYFLLAFVDCKNNNNNSINSNNNHSSMV